MYNLLIVDDEHLTVEWLRQTIKWDELGICVFDCAYNGEEALEIIKDNPIDILITDIKMPLMDGISLIKHSKALKPDMMVLVLSGFDEFEYAQKALRFGVHDYCIKPIENEKIVGIIKEMVEVLYKRQIEKLERLRMDKQIKESLPLLRKSLLKDLLIGDYQREAMSNRMSILDMDPHAYFEVMIIRINNLVKVIKDHDELEKAKIINTIMSISRLSFSKLGLNEDAILTNNDEVVCVLAFSSAHRNMELSSKVASTIQQSIEERLNITTTIAISRRNKSVYEIKRGYVEAHKAYLKKVLSKGNHIIKYDELSSGDKDFVYPMELEKELVDAVYNRNMELATTKLKDIFEVIVGQNYHAMKNVHRMMIELVTQINRLLYDVENEVVNVLGEGYDPIQDIHSLDTIDALYEYVNTIITKTIVHLDSKQDRSDSNIKKAIKYMEKHYDRDISVEDVAQYIHLSNNYFSQLFKNETGQSYIEYLTNMRMDKAKKLLKHKGLKILEVAQKVGYHDSKYFSQVFKKEVGMTPSEYRKQ